MSLHDKNETIQIAAGMEFGHLFVVNQMCTDEYINANFPSFFRLGQYSFEIPNYHGEDQRAIVFFRDETGKVWLSNQGEQNSNSEFEILISEPVNSGSNNILSQKVGGTITCTLYDSKGEFKILEKAYFVFRFSSN